MAQNELLFSVSGDNVYDPLEITTTLTVTVKNTGEEAITDLGLWISPSTNTGDVDSPGDFTPEQDYQDLLTWGTAVDNGDDTVGGVIVTLPQNAGPDIETRITRSAGSLKSNKLTFKDLAPDEEAEFIIEIENYTSGPTRRLYIDFNLE